MKIVHHPGLTFGSRFLNHFHPFEFDRAEVVLARLRRELGTRAEALLQSPEESIALTDLGLVHSAEYIASLRRSSVVAQVMEVKFLAFCPRPWIENWFLKPTVWSTTASLLGAETALREGCCLSLGGGFHHAKREGGEGFCIASDIAFVIETLRARSVLAPQDRVLYVDLDVHQGNGVSHYYGADPMVRIMDAFNREIYPVYGATVEEEVDIPLPLRPGCDDQVYLRTVKAGLERLFEGWESAKLIIYNAGTDIFVGDRLGGLRISQEGVRKRDLMVLRMAKEVGVPLLVLASGGYSRVSATLLGDLALAAVAEFQHSD